MDTIEKELDEMARYHDLLEMIETYFNGSSKKKNLIVDNIEVG
jgi:hypothetical protein